MAALFVAAQVLLWTAVPALVHHALPLDVVEGLAWGHEWQWGYAKHPPMPAWLLEAVHVLLGGAFLGPFLLSQLFVAATYGAAWLLAREMLGGAAATAALLLQSGILYFNYLTPEFNHNLAQMPLWAVAILMLWRACRDGRLRWWLGLGLALGAGVLTKYSIGTLMLAMVLYALTGAGTRRLLVTRGPWVAAAVAFLVALPHLVWLARTGFAPFAYAGDEFDKAAAASLLGNALVGAEFLAAQALNHLPLFLLALAGGLVSWRRRGGATAAGNTASAWADLPGEFRRFLLWMGLGPALVTALLALAGVGLRDMWGMPMFSISGVLAVALLRRHWVGLRPRALIGGAAGLLVFGALAYGVVIAWGPEVTGRHHRANWPARALAAEMGAGWQQATEAPLRVVVGDVWLAGNIALHHPAPHRPSVFIDGDARAAPWVTPADVHRHGALVVWTREGERQRYAALFPAMVIQPPLVIPWPDGVGEPLRVGWGVVPPAAADQG